ncbi:hypothetical protein QTP70_029015 [Hemibagrus guttatus]|uniref:DNA repair protein complementing XP-G cells n=1 Tax=Hemibagrus guttatus TaxID=175788 RepID=A0AAE0PZJ2_9TELE|nr:hypothetical protein QTP70_029015 [Hemibagrus guttatus]
MGVHGLWKLLESTGKPINPETLEGKILAVDISIWLNQAVKGVRDREGNNIHNAHLLTLFHRLCKLLFFRIRPVFIYDGDAPLLKKQTLAIRRQRKEEMALESKQTHEKLLRTFLKRQAIKAALGGRSKETIPSISSVRRDEEDELYVLPALPPVEEKERSSSDEEPEGDEAQTQECYLTFQDEIYENPNSIDINSEDFHILSPEIKHEILKDMKEFSKRRRTLYHKPPERSGDFSQYQLAGLLQRNNLNQRLEGVEKEMSQRRCGAVEEEYSQGEEHNIESRRLISEDSSHYILIKGSQKGTQTSESHPAPDPWSCGPWSRKGRPKGRPEPLWRPVSDGIPEENEPSSSSTPPKPINCSEEQPSDGAPPSPRTLQAIQAAMMDSSSDEEQMVSKKTLQDGNGTTGSQEGTGGASPRTLQAIQSRELADMMERRKVDILCVQENRWKGNKARSIGAGFKLFYYGVDSKRNGVGVVLKEEFVRNVLEVKRVSDRVMSLKLEIEGVMLNVVSGYAPQVGCELEEKERFWSELDEVMESIPTGERVVIGADFNGHVGEGNTGDEEVMGKFGVKERNLEGQMVVDFAKRMDMAVVNTYFQKREEHRLQEWSESREQVEENLERWRFALERRGMKVSRSFIEVSEGEEMSELDNSLTKSEQFPEVSNKEEVVGSDKEESQEKESSDRTLSLNNSNLKEQEAESSQEEATVPAHSEWENIDVEELVELEKSLQAEQSSLREQQQQQQRSAATVTGQMCQESQELLRLFGVPFVVAPMEAEAQCAALERTDQTHGTITDDSDIWLFGGRHVYKNLFNNNKYVEHYQFLDIQNQLGLDRTKLINLAYLLGSDYTEGIQGVGYVTGMEILNEFPGPGLEPLTQFSKWWNKAQTKKKLAADPKDTKVKKKLRGLTLHPGFPNPAVAEAYLQPTVDQSEGSFCWGRPQLDLLKEYPSNADLLIDLCTYRVSSVTMCFLTSPKFCYSRFGWNSRKTEETLQPVLKQLSTQQTQLRIDSFFRLEQQERQAIRSQRLRRAVTCLKRKECDGADNEEESSEDEKVSPVKKGKNGKEKGTDVTPAGLFGGGFIGLDMSMSSNSPEEKVIVGEIDKQPKTVKNDLPKAESSCSSSSEDELEHKNRATMVTARSVFEGITRGRGRRGGRGGRGKAKKNL